MVCRIRRRPSLASGDLLEARRRGQRWWIPGVPRRSLKATAEVAAAEPKTGPGEEDPDWTGTHGSWSDGHPRPSCHDQGRSFVNELVVGFDLSDESRFALRWAASLARAINVKLVVVEAWSGGDPATADQTGERVRVELAAAATDTLGEVAGDLDIEFEALRGSTAAVILNRVGPDSGLVLGSRGRGGFAGLLLGSVSRECIEHAPCPVMVVRHERGTPNTGAPIVVAHDGSSSAGRALEWAASVAQPTGAEVVAAYVWQAGASEVRPRLQERLAAAAADSIEGWARQVTPEARPVEIEGDPRMELVNLADRLDAALLVVGRRGKGTVRALRIGSVASYLVTSSPVAIAVIPPPLGEELS
jgi:nucleotide-binding universal stress UspA family protein